MKKLVSVGLDDSLPLFVMGHGLGATIVMRTDFRREKLSVLDLFSVLRG